MELESAQRLHAAINMPLLRSYSPSNDLKMNRSSCPISNFLRNLRYWRVERSCSDVQIKGVEIAAAQGEFMKGDER